MNQYLFEAFKVGIQLLAIVLIGKLIDLYIKRNDRKKQERQYRLEFKNNIFEKIEDLFVKTKSIRRKLRSKLIDYKLDDEDVFKEILNDYNVSLNDLSQIQLEFEKNRRILKTLYFDIPSVNDIEINIKKIDRYLESILQEHEKHQTILNTSRRFPEKYFPKLFDFIKPYHQSQFKENVGLAYVELSNIFKKSLTAWIDK